MDVALCNVQYSGSVSIRSYSGDCIMVTAEAIVEGVVYEVVCPFVFVPEYGDFEPRQIGVGYMHGMRFIEEYCDDEGVNDVIKEADAEGMAEFKVVKICKMPKPYHTRIFYRKRTVDPDDITDAWRPLKVCSLNAFRRLIAGKKWEGYRVV